MSVHSSRGPKWEALRQAVLERDAYTCLYCGGIATTVDHVVPKAMGGEDREDNCVASCSPCNLRKGSKLLERRNWFNPRHLPDGVW